MYTLAYVLVSPNHLPSPNLDDVINVEGVKLARLILLLNVFWFKQANTLN